MSAKPTVRPITLLLSVSQVARLRGLLQDSARALACDVTEFRRLPGLSCTLEDYQTTIADVLDQLPKVKP